MLQPPMILFSTLGQAGPEVSNQLKSKAEHLQVSWTEHWDFQPLLCLQLLLCLQSCCVYSPAVFTTLPTMSTALLCLQPCCAYSPTVSTDLLYIQPLLCLQSCCIYSPAVFTTLPTMSTALPCLQSAPTVSIASTVSTALLHPPTALLWLQPY